MRDFFVFLPFDSQRQVDWRPSKGGKETLGKIDHLP
jgi:hypothetical protein